MQAPAIDRLYSTFDAGQLLGGLTPEAVCQLGRDGKLELVAQVVRGEGKSPRRFVRESELKRYIEELEVHKRGLRLPKRTRRFKTGLAKEIAEAPDYI